MSVGSEEDASAQAARVRLRTHIAILHNYLRCGRICRGKCTFLPVPRIRYIYNDILLSQNG